MIINKIAKQKMEVLKDRQPDLFYSIEVLFPDISDDVKGRIAGLVIESVLKSNGDVSIFEDEFDAHTENF